VAERRSMSRMKELFRGHKSSGSATWPPKSPPHVSSMLMRREVRFQARIVHLHVSSFGSLRLLWLSSRANWWLNGSHIAQRRAALRLTLIRSARIPKPQHPATKPATNPVLFFCHSMKPAQPCKTLQPCPDHAQILTLAHY
jgi:hypothetical protein